MFSKLPTNTLRIQHSVFWRKVPGIFPSSKLLRNLITLRNQNQIIFLRTKLNAEIIRLSIKLSRSKCWSNCTGHTMAIPFLIGGVEKDAGEREGGRSEAMMSIRSAKISETVTQTSSKLPAMWWLRPILKNPTKPIYVDARQNAGNERTTQHRGTFA